MEDTPVVTPATRADVIRLGDPPPVANAEEPAHAPLPVAEPPPPAPLPWWDTGPGRAALITLVIFALAYVLQLTRELVLPIVVALLVAIVLSPIARGLRKLHLPHALAAGIV